MIYLFSGSIVEMIKETTISGFIQRIPEPSQDGIGTRYDDEPDEDEAQEGETIEGPRVENFEKFQTDFKNS